MSYFIDGREISFLKPVEFKGIELNIGEKCYKQGLYFLNSVSLLDAPKDFNQQYTEKVWAKVLTIGNWGLFTYQFLLHDSGVWYRGTYTDTFEDRPWINLGSYTSNLQSLEDRVKKARK
jgi:hypothetical protein